MPDIFTPCLTIKNLFGRIEIGLAPKFWRAWI